MMIFIVTENENIYIPNSGLINAKAFLSPTLSPSFMEILNMLVFLMKAFDFMKSGNVKPDLNL